MANVEVLVWDPIRGFFGRESDWTQANTQPLTTEEAQAMVAELQTCVDDYRGQGQTIHAVRVKR